MHKISKRKALSHLQHWTQYHCWQSIYGATLRTVITKDWVIDQLDAKAQPYWAPENKHEKLVLKHADNGIVTYIQVEEETA